MLLLGSSVTFMSCDKDDDNNDPIVITEGVQVTSNITANTTWSKENIYVLTKRVYVESGSTLTIEPGTIIKGQTGAGANATALVVKRGGKLMAEGTASEPIIFTCVADEIAQGETVSPNMDAGLAGLWGGVIILGNAPVSVETGTETAVEGIPPSEGALYGGSAADDNSGVIKYISIRHGGSDIGDGNEINGLTLAGVGSGTVIENVEVVANSDDGIEFFGGTVNVTNAVVWAAGDDAIDTDQAWAGTLSNFVVVCGSATDHALEIDGPEGTMLDGHTLTNGTVYGSEGAELANFRSGARGNFNNIFFTGFPNPADDGRGDFAFSGDDTQANFDNGILVFSNIQATSPADGVALTDVFKNGTDAHASFVQNGSVGANATALSWTWTSQSGNM